MCPEVLDSNLLRGLLDDRPDRPIAKLIPNQLPTFGERPQQAALLDLGRNHPGVDSMLDPEWNCNGLVGRLIITLFLIEQKISPASLLYLSAFFEATRRDYYDGLRAVSERGAWTDWLEYFLIGVARTAQVALSRASRINVILAQRQRLVAGESTNTPLRIVDP